MNKYQESMEHIKVDEDMKKRILQKVQDDLREDTTRGAGHRETEVTIFEKTAKSGDHKKQNAKVLLYVKRFGGMAAVFALLFLGVSSAMRITGERDASAPSLSTAPAAQEAAAPADTAAQKDSLRDTTAKSEAVSDSAEMAEMAPEESLSKPAMSADNAGAAEMGAGRADTNMLTENAISMDGKASASEDMAAEAEAGPEAGWQSPIYGLPEDYILGMDASMVLAEENSGVTYYDFEGNPQDVFQTFAKAGINYIRLRVWNDPYDENGKGYGGGNCDLSTALELGKRATKYGMKVCIDFHYSDFWADPKRQHAPKAWEGMDVEEKAEALYDFTKESLTQLLDAGVDVGMIQIGNEINYGMSGETKTENVIKLLKAGSSAIREVSAAYDKEIGIAVHYTRITKKAEVLNAVEKLTESGLDFDMVGMSYYPFWDGSMDNMARVLELIRERYGKKVFLAETSYAYTTADGDGCSNTFTVSDTVEGYPVSVEGQASMIRDICERVHEVGGLGVFYWEGDWIPVGDANADNSSLWETYGSGWASSFASDYDPEDAGLYYGGCAWDNQALYDFGGHPLESLKVFSYMRGQ